MERQDGQGQNDAYHYLWENLDDVAGAWNFDALNEGGINWNVWDEAALPPQPAAPAPTAAANDSRPQQRHLSAASSSSYFTNDPAFPPAATWPPTQLPQRESPALPASDAVALRSLMGNSSSTAAATTNIHAVENTRPSQSSRTTQASRALGVPHSTLTRTPVDRRATLPHSQANAQPRTFNLPPADLFGTYDTDVSESYDGIDIDDLLNTDIEDSEADMPVTTRRSQQSGGGGRGGGFVDLTSDSPPASSQSNNGEGRMQPHSLKRQAEAEEGRTSKRSRLSQHPNSASRPPQNQAIEALDLTNEAPSAEEELLQAQQQAAIAAQQAADEEGKGLKLGQRQCIICMESFTDITITHCGHVYCHECLTQALNVGEKNGERGVGNCPVCRKPVARKKANQMIALSFMKKATFKGKARRDVQVGA